MRGLETSVVKLRHEVFKEVAKVAFDSEPENVNNDIEAIPYTITPTEVPQYCAPRTNRCTSRAGWIRATFRINITSRPSCR